ncbi:hypothetical protein BTA51_22790 [Hahella sp. CCB-MM4]|uniref:tandem-95 repeat protein n=1 Tax=Hahella sp. (strain CCB-MM4) TaxID=1926491 RepID=UPI000B9AAF40|nr:tandem-95 repeat protein [Hahella sp. CCB-MM4]OZG70938.1 hypothetical protein BTA51_22790 [Hahella sp. CCB-MM4]
MLQRVLTLLGVVGLQLLSFSVSAQSFNETPDIVIEPDFCSLYPITVSSQLLQGAQPGQNFSYIPLGTGPGNYNWLSWNGRKDANTVAYSLTPPGNSQNYVNPGNQYDRKLNASDWVQGTPGVKNSASIRRNLDALLQRNIIIPVWDNYSGKGAHLNYQIGRFAVVALQDYRLNGKGYLSFTFKRFTRCYNSRPVALDQSISLDEDASVNFALLTEDADGNSLSYDIIEPPLHGSIELNGAQATYIPAADFYGSDNLSFQVNDGEQLSEVASVSFEIRAVNDRPVVVSQTAEGPEDAPIDLSFSGSDIENDPLTFRPVSQPQHGTLIETADGYQYIPQQDYFGSDQFTYVANDGELDSETAVYSLNILPINDPPVADAHTSEAAEDTAIVLNLSGSDVEGSPLSFRVVTQPLHGSIQQVEGGFQYIPAPDYFGSDSFEYLVNDGELDSQSATYSLNILPVNDPPVAIPGIAEGMEDSTINLSLAGSDVENDSLSFKIVSAPQHGSIVQSEGQYQYIPVQDFFGSDSFEYVAQDGELDSEAVVYELNVLPVNDRPTAENLSVEAESGVPVSVTLKGSDVESSELTFKLVGEPLHGEVILEGHQLTYIPDFTFDGLETLEFVAFDGETESEVTTLEILVKRPLEAAGQQTHEGKNFWLPATINYITDGNLHIYMVSPEHDANVTINMQVLGISESLELVAGEISTYTIPLSSIKSVGGYDVDKLLEKHAIHIESDKNIVVYALNQATQSTDSFLALPVEALGRRYVVGHYFNGPGKPVIGLVATQDNTAIQVRPTMDMFVGGQQVKLGEILTLNLNAGDVYNLDATGSAKADLTGTLIDADKPVVVMGEHTCAYVPSGVRACDHLVEQMPPLDSLGTAFVTVPFYGRGGNAETGQYGDTFRIVAPYENTEVYIDGVLSYRLSSQQYAEFVAPESQHIKTSKPSLLLQFSNSDHFDNTDPERVIPANYVDPFMVVVPPVEQFLSSYNISTSARELRYQFINVLAPVETLDTLTLDNQPVDAQSFVVTTGGEYAYAQIRVSTGSHKIEADAPFGIYIYGYDDYESYGHLGGMAFSLPGNVQRMVVDGPQESSAGEQICVVATLYDADFRPVNGARVTFTAEEIRPRRGDVFTDETGRGKFCYTSFLPGTETLFVEAGAEHTTHSVQWLSTEQNLPPEILSLPSLTWLAGEVYSYAVEAVDAEGGVLSYHLTHAPDGMIITDDGLVEWTNPQNVQDQLVVLEVSDEQGATAVQSYRLSEYQAFNTPPEFLHAEPTSTAVVGVPYLYNQYYLDKSGLRTVVGLQDIDGDSYELTMIQGADEAYTLKAGSKDTFIWTPKKAGQQDFELNVRDYRGGVSTQTFSVDVAPNVSPKILSNNPPTGVVVGQAYDYVIDVENDVPFSSTYNDDRVTARVSKGPKRFKNNAKLITGTNKFTLHWKPGEADIGTHQVGVMVYDSQLITDERLEFSIEVRGSNQLPEFNNPPVYTAVVDNPYQYQIDASDADGDNITLGIVDGPEGMTLSSDGLVSWTPDASQLGIQDVTLYADDGFGKTLLSYSINVTSEPVPLSVNVTVDPAIVNADEIVSIDILASGGQGARTMLLLVDNQEVAVDSFGHAEITSPDSGVHIVEAAVTDGVETVMDSTRFSVRDPADTSAPFADITSPEYGMQVTAPIEIIGSVQDENLALYRVLVSPRGQQSWQVIAEGYQAVTDAVLATLDPSLMMNGQYDVALYAEDVNGLISTDSTVISVEGDLKVGNFSITLEDLNIPMAGIPIRVTRTYDSRRRSEDLDFGYGWSLSYQDVKVEESRTLGTYWALNQYKRGPSGLILDFCVEPLGAPVVTVTLPDGDVERFEVAATPQCSTYSAILDVDLKFNPVGDTQSTLEALDNQHAHYENGQLLETGEFSGPVNPERYLLTTQAGYKYYLKQGVGIEKVVDPNGYTLTYTYDGIFHSSGKAVTFNRNSEGKITSITDPKGSVLTYTQDENGNLTASADTLGEETTYTYNRNHGLQDIIDPLGRTIVRNIYDDDGRLIAQEDSDGNRTEFDHNIEGRQSVVTDRNGNTTFYYYNDRGDVTSKVDAEGQTWSYTYDDRGNQLSQTDPLGHVTSSTYDDRGNQLSQTDELGNTVSFTYNTRGQELTISDARGNVYTNTYDGVGNLMTVTDPHGNQAENILNFEGLVGKTKDVAGYTTLYTYDEDGNKLTETNPLRAVTSYTYDDNGNVLTETQSRTVDGVQQSETTTYVYDARNRVVEMRYADGSTTTTEYDAAGNQIATEDAWGRRTEMDYDVYGRVNETRYPDGSFESKTYDAEGNVLTETDRLGRVTSYTYDKLNRVTRTDFADGSFTSMTYDEAGRVATETDANGHTTGYEYDAAGRRTAVVDALNQRHSFAYDEDGNLISETDANGHTTTYEYNSLDQRVKTIYDDGSFTQEAFDALGRRISSTDQAGKTTQYSYDAVGRLTKVTDVLGQATTYSYDEVGNKLTQTDAEGRTTRWTYDSMGRVLTRTLPMGQVESFSYDVSGNVLTHTDFNGQVTTYSYDINNRVIRIDYADGEVDNFKYDGLGNRIEASNSQGTTTYAYDRMNRLVQEVQPSGVELGYDYDKAGNKTETTVTANGATETTTYLYDELNRLTTVIDPTGGRTLYIYDAVGNRETVSLANNQATSYEYDNLNRLTRLTTIDSLDNIITDYRYTLHITGRRTQIEELHTGRTSTYTYDDLYRLTKDQITDPINGNYLAEYQYDKVGNRTYSIIDGVHTAYSYDDNDRLTQQGGVSYRYDANGNTLTETEDGVSKTYTYNAKNQLTAATQGGNRTTYGYNVDGIRTQKTDGALSTNYVVDSNRDYAQVLQEITNGTKQVSYVYGDDLLSQARNGNQSYYVYDGLGSVRSLTDTTGAETDTYQYDAFGILLASTGTTENDYRYTGEQYDAGLDQYYLRARYYDQGVGRFTQMDTWMGVNSDPVTLHKYMYANSDPVMYTDPTGNFSIGSLMSGIGNMARLAGSAIARTPSLLSRAATSTGNFGRGALRLLSKSKSYLKRLAKKCKIKNNKPTACGYAKGLLEAELKIQILVSTTPNSKKNGPNPRVVVVGAFDSARGRGTAAFNGFAKGTPAMKKRLQLVGLRIGQENACGTTNTVGRCAEYRAAHKLLRSGSKLKHIYWTPAYRVTKGPGGHLKVQREIDYCNICKTGLEL